MKPKIILSLMSLTFASIGYAHEFKTPESMVFEPETQCYYVSNFHGNSISKVDLQGNASDFVTGLSAPLGLTVDGKTLYAIDSPKWIKGFDLETGDTTFVVEIPDAMFLNDLTTDHHGAIYATDSRAGTIYQINIETHQFAKLLDQPNPGNNGILYDPIQDRLIVCTFKAPAKVFEVKPKTHESRTLAELNLLNLDGITTDSDGHFYISCWNVGSFAEGFGNQAGFVYRFDSDFSSPPEIVLDGFDGPADINFCEERQEFLIPLFLSNEIKVIPIH